MAIFLSLLSLLNVCSWCDIEQCLVTNFQWVWRWHRRHWTKASQGSHTHTAEQFSLWDAFSNGLQRHLPSFGSASAYKVLLHVLAAIRRMGKSIGPKVYHQGSLLLLYTVSHQSPKDKNSDAETIGRIKGTCGASKTDGFSEKFQTAFAPPPPHFRKIILRIF